MAKSLMILGTGSGAGKSLMVTALCRIFRDMGVNVAPFKAQNMALNSYITADGGEIGRAQALQAEGARIEATVDMNPVLLKASGEMGSQVILRGKAHSHMKATEYYAFKKEAWKTVTSSYERLSNEYDLIVMEGAGSPAEINLMDVDIVNISMAKYAKAPALLVGDIDKGGVFASLYGTVKLLGRDSRHIKGFIINKFRGDLEILRPGLDMIREKTRKPVLGVLPYVFDIGLPEEDGLGLHKISNLKFHISNAESLKIVVVRLKYISNFTDFDPLVVEPDVELVYSDNPAEIENADMVIIPGSKNTVKDLIFLSERRLDESLKRASEKGLSVMGMCGGYQMLGRKIFDPHGVESIHQEVDGLGLLNIETTFERSKTTCRVEAELTGSIGNVPGSLPLLSGYEIHMGGSTGDIGLFRLRRLSSSSSYVQDGSVNGNCWGTYIHGIFENDLFRRSVLNGLREKKGLSPLDSGVNYSGLKDAAIDNLAKVVGENLDMAYVKRLVGL